jgi:hypothetical protein
MICPPAASVSSSNFHSPLYCIASSIDDGRNERKVISRSVPRAAIFSFTCTQAGRFFSILDQAAFLSSFRPARQRLRKRRRRRRATTDASIDSLTNRPTDRLGMTAGSTFNVSVAQSIIGRRPARAPTRRTRSVSLIATKLVLVKSDPTHASPRRWHVRFCVRSFVGSIGDHPPNDQKAHFETEGPPLYPCKITMLCNLISGMATPFSYVVRREGVLKRMPRAFPWSGRV